MFKTHPLFDLKDVYMTFNGESFMASDVLSMTTFGFASLSEIAQTEVLKDNKRKNNTNAVPVKKCIGSNGDKCCDACGKEDGFGAIEVRDASIQVCTRCKYSICKTCSSHPGFGACYCKHQNFGKAYPKVEERTYFQFGRW